MKKTFCTLMIVFTLLALAGCGGGGDGNSVIVKQILSDETVDGDIALDPVTNALTVTQVNLDPVAGPLVPSVFAGVRPLDGVEFRAFLDFPLVGIPLNAIISSATLDIVINSIEVQPANAAIPIRIELVSFPPPLLPTDFDRVSLPPLATTTIIPPISLADLHRHVTVDVTPLLQIAQDRGFPSFQVRILEDFGLVPPGRIEIDEASNATAPLLRVAFF